MLWNLKRGIFTALLVFYVAGCGAAKDGTNITISDIGNVEGTVTDSSSSTALSGVTVQIGLELGAQSFIGNFQIWNNAGYWVDSSVKGSGGIANLVLGYQF